jgi:hypothetical protein
MKVMCFFETTADVRWTAEDGTLTTHIAASTGYNSVKNSDTAWAADPKLYEFGVAWV